MEPVEMRLIFSVTLRSLSERAKPSTHELAKHDTVLPSFDLVSRPPELKFGYTL